MVDKNYGTIVSADNLEKLLGKMTEQNKPFGFDIEAGYTGPERDGIALAQFHPDWILVGFSFTNDLAWARYVPVAHDDGFNIDDPKRAAVALWKLLQTGMGVAHNLSYELKGLSRWFMETIADDPEVGAAVTEAKGFFPYRSDSMIEAFLTQQYDPLRVGKDLKNLTLEVFGHKMVKFLELWDDENIKGKTKYVRFNTRSAKLAKVVNYACEDSVWCLALHFKHYPEVTESELKFIYQVEMKLLPVLAEMESVGLALDWDRIGLKSSELAQFRDLMNEEIQVELSERLGVEQNLNLGSPQKLGQVLFAPIEEGGLGIPVKMRSKKTNKPSTSAKALALVAKADPMIKKILQYREVVKLYGSYLHKYETQLNYKGNGRAYPNHNQVGAGTGRLSVDGVSYQQWPKPYHYGLKDGREYDLNFRNLLIAPENYRIIGFDFSQVELRVLAGMANEKNLLAAFESGVDIHRATASSMMGIPLDQVTKKQRSQGKTLNFAVVYGSGADNIADMLTSPEAPVTKEDAEELLRKYFEAFPDLKKWMAQRKAEGSEQGFVETMFGRKYTIWEYRVANRYIHSKGDRMCTNAPVQGGAADYMKMGMVRVQRDIKKAGLQDKIQLVMTVHDALEFYVADDVDTQTVIDLVNPAVSFPVKGLPEIRADWHEGLKWGSVVEIKLDDQKKISGYGLEDVDQEFTDILDAYDYLASHAIEHDVLFEAEADEDDDDSSLQRATYITKPEDPLPDWLANPLPHITIEQMNGPQESSDEPEWAHSKTYEPTKVVVSIKDMPTTEQYVEWLALLKKLPGANMVTLATPEGDIEYEGRYDLWATDQLNVSLILGGAMVQEFERVS